LKKGCIVNGKPCFHFGRGKEQQSTLTTGPDLEVIKRKGVRKKGMSMVLEWERGLFLGVGECFWTIGTQSLEAPPHQGKKLNLEGIWGEERKSTGGGHIIERLS